MNTSISRRILVLAACTVGIAVWAVASHAAPASFKVALSGAEQVPAVETPGKGTADLTYDPATRMLTWSISYEGLSAPATMAHFHGPAAAGQERPGHAVAEQTGKPAGEPDQGRSHADARTGGAVHRRRVVRQRPHRVLDPGGEIRGQVMPPKS